MNNIFIKAKKVDRGTYGYIEGLNIDEDGDAIEGSIFGLFEENKTEFTVENAVMITSSGSDGKFRIKCPHCGRYILRELSPAIGFVTNNASYLIECCKNSIATNVCVENRYIHGDIVGKKRDENGVFIAGVQFGLFLLGDTKFTIDNAIRTTISDENGIFHFNGVRFGSWIVCELMPVECLSLNKNLFYVEIKTDGSIIEIM